jgi:hypothetical protein
MIDQFETLLAKFQREGFPSKLSLTRTEDQLNLFEAVSDTNYRETFHSDVIAFLLKPYKGIQQNKTCLDIFIGFLNRCYCTQIDYLNYNTYDVFREQNHFDIFIVGKPSSGSQKHSIQAVDLTGRDFGVPSKNLRLRAQVISPAGQTAFIAVLVPLESDLSASLVLLIRLSEQTSSSYYAA